MQRRSFLHDMRGLSLETKQRILADGPVHNFMESAAGAIDGLPDLDTDPEARAIVAAIHRGIKHPELGITAIIDPTSVADDENGNGNGHNGNGNGHAPEQEPGSGEPE